MKHPGQNDARRPGRPARKRPVGQRTPANSPVIAVRARRRLGQNFLVDLGIAPRIADAAEIAAGDTVLEIGPGTGLLTRHLVARARRVVAVEIDERMKPDLEALGREHPNLTVIWGDFLKLGWQALGLAEALAEGPAGGARSAVRVVANIPYYITTPILLDLLQARQLEARPLAEVAPRAEAIVLMVQKEVAERMIAVPGTKAYGSLSVLVQYAAEVEIAFGVSRTAFVPRPEVDSAVVRLKPRRSPPVPVASPATFFRVVRGAFGQRRKILMNALLAAAFDKRALELAFDAAGIDPGRRGETLDLSEIARLADALV